MAEKARQILFSPAMMRANPLVWVVKYEQAERPADWLKAG